MPNFYDLKNDKCDMGVLRSTVENNDSILIERLEECFSGKIPTKALTELVENQLLFSATRESLQFEKHFLIALVEYCWRYNIAPKRFRFLCAWFDVPYTEKFESTPNSDQKIWHPVGDK